MDLPILLIAAKYDLKEFSMMGDILEKKNKNRFSLIDYIKTSSKTGRNVDLAFEKLARHILKIKQILI